MLAVVQVTLDKPTNWPDDAQKALGQMLIACSQWEHIG